MIRTFKPHLSLSAGLAAIALLSVSPVLAQEDTDEPAKEMTEGEAELAKLLEGRVAGEPQDCIRGIRNIQLRTINETAYVYGRGRTIYVQRTQSPEDIDDDNILFIQRFGGTRVCRLDFITTVERFTGIFTGGVQFDHFIPYTKVDKDAG